MFSPFFAFALLYAALYAAYGTETPFLPSFMKSRGIGPEQIGAVFAAGTITRVLVGPLFGRVADLFHATRKCFALCAASASIVALGYLAAWSFPVFLLIGIAHAFVSAPLAPFADTLSLRASSEEAAFQYGWVRAAGSAAFVLGVLASGHIVSAFGLRSIIFFSALLLAATAACAVFLPRGARTDRDGVALRSTDGAAAALFRNALFVRTMLTAMIVMGSHVINDTFAVIRWDQAGLGASTASILWSVAVASEVLVFASIGKPLIDWLGTSRAAAVSVVAGVVRWSVMATTVAVPVIVVAQMLHGLTFALLHLVCMRVIDASVPPHLGATAQTIYNNFCLSLASAALTFASGFAYSRFGASSFWFAAIFCAAALPLALSLRLSAEKQSVG